MADPIFFANVILAIQKSALDRNEKHILSALCGLVDWSTWSKQVPIRYVAIRASVSNDTVHRTIGALVTKGLIAYSVVDGGAPDWVINAQAIIDLETCSLKAAPSKKQIAGGETQDAAGEPQNAAPSNLPQSAAAPQQSAAPKTQSAAGPAQIAAASPILLSDPPTQSISSNPTRPPKVPRGTHRDHESPSLFGAPEKRPTKRAPKSQTQSATATVVPAKPEKPPMPPHLELSPLAGLFRGLWYGTECVLTDGPNATLFSACAAAISAWQAEHGGSVAMDRKGYNPIRDTIRGWLDSGESVENLLMAVRAKPDKWESDSGFTVGLRCRNVASLAKALAKERTRRENESSRVDDLGRMQHGFGMSEHDFFYGPGGKK